MAEAVAYAHEKGVIHRDLKPGVILIDQSGQPRVSDFDLGKQVSSDNEMTTTGQILGTPSYMQLWELVLATSEYAGLRSFSSRVATI